MFFFYTNHMIRSSRVMNRDRTHTIKHDLEQEEQFEERLK